MALELISEQAAVPLPLHTCTFRIHFHCWWVWWLGCSCEDGTFSDLRVASGQSSRAALQLCSYFGTSVAAVSLGCCTMPSSSL